MSIWIRVQADDFFNAYLVLSHNNEAMMERLSNTLGKPLVGSEELGTRPTLGVEIVCLAFSVELYIKDLHFAINGKVPRDHDILELFEELPESIRHEIFTHDSISQNSFIARGDPFSVKRYSATYTAYGGFIDNIKLISDGFIKWRYSYEKAALHYNSWFAMAFIESVKSVADAVRQRSQNPHLNPEPTP